MSKENILKNINQNKPDLIPLMNIPAFVNKEEDLVLRYEQMAKNVGIQFISKKEGSNIPEIIQGFFEKKSKIVNLSDSIKTLPKKITDIDVLVINGQYGIAENAAIWVDENDCPIRILPFITQNLVILLKKNNLVLNMHQAYQKIKIDDTGFGVFIAGPSKTADIEQSLVIGAQAARKMFVFFI